MRLGRSLVAGFDKTTGSFRNNGAVRVADDLVEATIGRNAIGNPTNPAIISARGQEVPSAAFDLAIGIVTIGGSVDICRLLPV